MSISDWNWCMDYCKKQGISPAQSWAWDKAITALEEYKQKRGCNAHRTLLH